MDKWFTVSARGKDAAEVTIFGDIGYGYTAADFDRELKALGKVDEVAVRLNSHGGDVFQGNAIYNILKRQKAKIIVTVEGLAASMGSVIMMAGDERIMPSNSQIMIHNPVGGIEGGVDEIKSFAEMLGNLETGIAQAYVDATGLTLKEVRSMMDKETWLTAERAVALGFATKVEKPVKVAASGYNLGRFKNVPKGFGTQPQEDDTMAEDRSDDIKRVCALVGKSHLAEGFITDKKSVGDVLAALDAIRKDDEQKVKDAAAAKTAADAAAAAAAGKKPGETTETKVVDAAAVRAQLVEENKEITALCGLAGMSDKANEFIVAGKTVTQVIAALDEIKKTKANDAGNQRGQQRKTEKEITAHNNVARGNADNVKVLDTDKVWGKFNKRKTA